MELGWQQMEKLEPIELDGVGILEINAGGFEHTNQAGGYACNHPVERGAVVPSWEPAWASFVDGMLGALFVGPKYNGWCCRGIDEEDARLIDIILGTTTRAEDIWTVDRARMKDSMEAWVYLASEGGYKGVLFSRNSD